jgi:serine/threonine protein kinase
MCQKKQINNCIFNNNNYIENQKNNSTKLNDYYKNISNMTNFLKRQKNANFLKNFELLNYINSGSSGIVYEGFHRTNPEKSICFKFLMNNSSTVKNKKNINNYPKEIYIHNKLKHKNIIEYYDFFDFNNFGCIAMEYAKFGDLEYFQRILNRKRYFSETLLVYIAKQVLDGLYYLHKSKIIHMDIKPQNILIDDKLMIKITDFSNSFILSEVPHNKKIFLPLSGTYLYMSPEILTQSSIDFEDFNKIDLFSFGIVLYNLAYEQFPYNLNYSYKNNCDLMYKKIQKEELKIPKLRNYSDMFINFLSGLLEKDIKKRTNIIEALENPWIKGAELLFEEKEKIYDLEIFLINMITDNIRSFNEYLKINIVEK